VLDGRCQVAQKCLATNQWVSGAVDDFILGPLNRHHCDHWFGHIVHAIEEKRYIVCFDNREERELPSEVLKVEHLIASLPPDIPIPTPQNA
jgi:hypothetical protein